MKTILFQLSALLLLTGVSFSQETWSPISTTNVLPRQTHATVWTGTKMIVWGGNGANLVSRIGNIYNPASNTWSAMDSANAPPTCNIPAAVWTGNKMIVWGGQDYNGNSLRTGGIYDPSPNSWTTVSQANSPSARCFHTAVWTGTKMIVWGGYYGTFYNTGGQYDPSNNSWTQTSTTNAPSERIYHIAVWTGSKMIVWGGESSGNLFENTGGIYDPVSDSWTVMSTVNAPTGRWNPAYVWTGSKMIVWGGEIDVMNGTTKTGGMYDPLTNTWQVIDSTGAPSQRTNAKAIWTGSRMVVWGGINMAYLNTGGIYNPSTNSWTATTMTNVPLGRQNHSMVWTGSNIIVWGGGSGSYATNTGSIYYNSSIGISKIGIGIPGEFSLGQNYPNPFNPLTRIKFAVPENGQVTLKVYDVLGKEVATLVNERMQPGTYEVTWDATGFGSGVYFCKLTAGEFISVKRMALIK